MAPIVCPFEKYICGRDTSDITINMGETREVVLGRLFDEVDSCHYTFGVWDQMAPEDVYQNNTKFLQIYVEKFDGLDIFVANASVEGNINIT